MFPIKKIPKNLVLNFKRHLHVLYNSHFKLSEEIRDAIETKKPVVALESTILTHGMPYPDNVRCAVDVESIVRKQGAVPATIAVIEGKLRVGLTEKEIYMLGDTKVSKAVKTSRRDIPYVLSNRMNGGTTVCGTILIADRVGIPVFATGGIGGVHRGAERSFDISADLIELGRCGVAVVSSGVKSILDIPKTLEYLETVGVFVATYGNTNDFPAFYSRKSGSVSPYRIQNPRDAANVIKCSMDLKMKSGMLFAVPIPEEYNIPYEAMNMVIENVLTSLKSDIQGKDITPYLLAQVAKHTEGKSLKSNIALIENNACVAADIAVQLSRLTPSESEDSVNKSVCGMEQKNEHFKGGPVIIGGSNLDCSAVLESTDIQLDGRMYDARFTYTPGGVGRNICEALLRLGVPPTAFLTAVGDDDQGRLLLTKGNDTGIFRDQLNLPVNEARKLKDSNSRNKHGDTANTNVDDFLSSLNELNGDGQVDRKVKIATWSKMKGIRVLKGARTAHCAIVLDGEGDSRLLLGDMDIHSKISPKMVSEMEDLIKNCPLLIMDGNVSVDTMEEALKLCVKHNVPVFFEPTDRDPSIKPFLTDNLGAVKFISPNLQEARCIANHLEILTDRHLQNAVDEAKYYAGKLLHFIDNVIVTLGADGVLVGRWDRTAKDPFLREELSIIKSTTHFRHYKISDHPEIKNVSGAGDCFASGFIAGILADQPEDICISIGFAAAKKALGSYSAVPDIMFGREDKSWNMSAKHQPI